MKGHKERRPGRQVGVTALFRAIVTGIALALLAANVWPLILLSFGATLAGEAGPSIMEDSAA